MKFSILSFACFLLSASLLRAQVPASPGLDVKADRLQFEAEANTATASGNVIIRKGSQSLMADTITYNTRTEQVFARGNVVFTNGEQIWRGEELRYNFITGAGNFGGSSATPGVSGEYGPFKMLAGQAQRVSEVQTQLSQVTVTTCPETQDPEFAIRSSKVDIYEQQVISMKNPVFYLRGVPFFWMPRFVYDQKREPTNIDVIPGYGSRDGFFLLNSLNRYPAEGYRTKTHLDLRSERGIAFGQDFIWYDPVANRDHTRLKSYLAFDDAPYKTDEQEQRLRDQGVDIDKERYRLGFFHQSAFTPTDTLRVKAAYLSDARVVQDFFLKEFRSEPVPETRATYSSVGDGWTSNLEVNKQLNSDDFGAVNRLPEGTFTVPRRRIGDTNFLYDSETRGGYLERSYSSFERDNGDESYEALRLHTDQKVYYPTRHFGWLNVVPRTGITLTHYGDTRGEETRITPTSTVGTNNVITTTFQTNTVSVAESADMRILPEIGLESSFKAFGLIHDDPTVLGRGLRHVVEPSINYTFIPEPDLTQDEIYQFDSIDELGEAHNVALGVRNKFQTKRLLPSGRHQIHDFANIGVSTLYDLRSEADPALGNLLLDAEFRLIDSLYMRFDSQYNSDTSEFDTFNSEIRLESPETKSWVSFNSRYRTERDHVLQVAYNLNPKGKVGLEGYTRYELEESGWEEQEILLRYETDCVGYGLGVKWIAGDEYADGSKDDDDYTLWLQLWLTAFPRGILNLGGR